MPSSSPTLDDFKNLIQAIIADNLDSVKSLLHPDGCKATYAKELLGMRDPYIKIRTKQTALMYCCEKTSPKAFNMIRMMCEEIIKAGGLEMLQEELCAEDACKWTCLTFVCRLVPSFGVVKFIIDVILRVGGKKTLHDLLLRTYTNTFVYKDPHYRHTCFSKALGNDDVNRDTIFLLACHLYDFNAWSKTFASLHEDDKYTLDAGVDIGPQWKPSEKDLTSTLSTGSFYFVDMLRNTLKDKKNMKKSNNSSEKNHDYNDDKNSIDEEEDLQTFLEKKVDYLGGRTSLMEVCKLTYDDKALQTQSFKSLWEDIIREVGCDFFFRQLMLVNRDEDNMNCVLYLCRYCVSEEVLHFMFVKMMHYGTRREYYDMLRSQTASGKSCLKLFLEKKKSSASSSSKTNLAPLLCHILSYLGLFEEQSSRLSDAEEEMLIKICNNKKFKWDPTVISQIKGEAYKG